MNLIAIDPGASGGFAAMIDSLVTCQKMPETQPDILRVIMELKGSASNAGITACYIEDLPKYIGAASKSVLAVMFDNFGFSKGVLQALQLRTILVTPQRWQKHFGFGTKGLHPQPKAESTKEERTRIQQANAIITRDWKNKLKAEAQRRFPAIEVTLKTCDALLLLDYARHCENYREVEQHTPFALKG